MQRLLNEMSGTRRDEGQSAKNNLTNRATGW